MYGIVSEMDYLPARSCKVIQRFNGYKFAAAARILGHRKTVKKRRFALTLVVICVTSVSVYNVLITFSSVPSSSSGSRTAERHGAADSDVHVVAGESPSTVKHAAGVASAEYEHKSVDTWRKQNQVLNKHSYFLRRTPDSHTVVDESKRRASESPPRGIISNPKNPASDHGLFRRSSEDGNRTDGSRYENGLDTGRHIYFPLKTHGTVVGGLKRRAFRSQGTTMTPSPKKSVSVPEDRSSSISKVTSKRPTRQNKVKSVPAVFRSLSLMQRGGTYCSNCSHFSMPIVPEKIKRICGNADTKVELVIMVTSEVSSFEARQTLRDTWLTPSGIWASQVRHVFLVGQSSSASVSSRLTHEAEAHWDVLQGDFPDSYRHLTFKTMLGLTWVTRHCRHARHVLKTDQDVWVNLPPLLSYLRSYPLLPNVGAAGHCKHTNRPDRNPLSKYFVPHQLFPDPIYPPFCNGPGYVTTPAVAMEIARVSRDVPFFHLEDVFVGFCLRSLHLHVQNLPGFGVMKTTLSLSELCQTRGNRVILRHGFTPDEIRVIWEQERCLRKPAALKVGLPLSKRRAELNAATGPPPARQGQRSNKN